MTGIQSKAAELIQAISYFASVAVISDDGYQLDKIEERRRAVGFVVVVREIDDISVQAVAQDMSFGVAGTTVTLSENPEVNWGATGAAIDMERALYEVTSAVQAWDATNGTSYFHLAGPIARRSAEGLNEWTIALATPVVL